MKLILLTPVLSLFTLAQGVDVPDSIRIAVEPEDVLEMETIRRPLSTYIADAKGKMITDLDGGTWTCEVSVAAGPGGTIAGTTSVSFVNGTATFSNLFLTEEGADYVLQFEVTFPTSVTLAPVNTTAFTVGPRPLGVRLAENPNMRAGKTPFTVRATIWDQALDQAATATVLAGLGWECSLGMLDKKIVIAGNTLATVDEGNGIIIFEDVRIPKLGNDRALLIECYSPDHFPTTISGQSEPFIVYDFPRTGLLRKTVAKIQFEGPYDLVEDAIVAFNDLKIHGEATCLGCPPGVLPKPKEMEKAVTPPPITDWDPCTAPIFLNPDLSCMLAAE